MKRIKYWWLAWMCDYPFFIVIYKDGRRTHHLYQSEALGLKTVFNGKLIIDYVYAENFCNSYQKQNRIKKAFIWICVNIFNFRP